MVALLRENGSLVLKTLPTATWYIAKGLVRSKTMELSTSVHHSDCCLIIAVPDQVCLVSYYGPSRLT
ncbi:hypothetical protein OAF74_03200, partial [bacterium]|nr:hypothetical protein [bacterium]